MTGDGYEQFDACLFESVFDFLSFIRWIDVDQNAAYRPDCKHGDEPFGVVCRPDPDAVSGLNTHGKKSAGGESDLFLQLFVTEALIGAQVYQGVSFVSPG